jgi:hypothetical protein
MQARHTAAPRLNNELAVHLLAQTHTHKSGEEPIFEMQQQVDRTSTLSPAALMRSWRAREGSSMRSSSAPHTLRISSLSVWGEA